MEIQIKLFNIAVCSSISLIQNQNIMKRFCMGLLTPPPVISIYCNVFSKF